MSPSDNRPLLDVETPRGNLTIGYNKHLASVGQPPEVENPHNDPDKIFQVRYRNPRHMLEIFWAEDVLDFGTSFRFTGCRIMRIATSEGTGMFKNYHERLESITIPNTLAPTTLEADQPEWWKRTREEAEAELKRMAKDPIATEIGRQVGPFSSELFEWLQQYYSEEDQGERL